MRNPLSSIGHLAVAARDAAHEFVRLFAAEGRLASQRLVRTTVFGVMAGTFFAVAWLAFSLAVAAVLVNVYEWGWPVALCLVGAVHVVAATVLALLARHTAKAQFFPRTLAQLHGTLSTEVGPSGAKPVSPAHSLDAQADMRLHEARLEIARQQIGQRRQEIEKQIGESRAAAKSFLTHPAVLVGAVGVGLLLGMSGSSSRSRVKALSRRVTARDASNSSSPFSSLLRQPVASAVLGSVAGHVQRAAVAQASAYAMGLLGSWLARRQLATAARPAANAGTAAAHPPVERRRQPTVLRLVHERRSTGTPHGDSQ